MTGVANVADGVVKGLKEQPLALALVVVNVLFLGAGAWFLSRVADAQEKRDALIIQLVKDCGAKT